MNCLNKKLESLSGAFFNTPMVEIKLLLNGSEKKIYAKYEAFNFSGSVKDRMAYYIFKHGYDTGALKEGQPIVEVTSGNTGIAVTALARALGHEITIIMPDWLSQERYAIMELMGANVIKVSKEEGGFIGSLEQARAMAQEKNMFYPDQFSNIANIQAHAQTTAPEIEKQLAQACNIKLDHCVAGVGTGGTIMGLYEYFSHQFHSTMRATH